jgi:predicted porin
LAAAGGTKSTVNTLGANYTMGQTVLMAQMGTLKDVAGNKSKLNGYGADYNLSKTTALYFRAESINDVAAEMNAAVTSTAVKGTGTKFTRTAIGLRTAF